MARSGWRFAAWGLVLVALGVAGRVAWQASEGSPEPPSARYLGCLGESVPGSSALKGKKRPPKAAVRGPEDDRGPSAEGEDIEAPGDAADGADGVFEDEDRPDALTGADPPTVLVPITTVAAPYADGLSGDVSTPLWSRSQKHLAYEVSTLSGTEIVIAGVVGTSPRPGLRIEGTVGSWGGAWLPVPELLLFIGGDPPRVRFHAPGGTSSVEMIHADTEPGPLTAVSPSPDGSRLAYVAGASRLAVWSRATGGVARFETPGARNPIYSQDGASLLYDAVGTKGIDVHRLVPASGDDKVVAGGDDDEFRAVDLGPAGVLAFVSDGASTWIAVYLGGAPRIVAERVSIGPRGRPAVSPDGAVVAWAPVGARRLALTRIADGETVEVDVPLPELSDVALAVQGKEARIAFTYLDMGRRRLAIADVSEAYAEVTKK